MENIKTIDNLIELLDMRFPTLEECQNIDKYIESISENIKEDGFKSSNFE